MARAAEAGHGVWRREGVDVKGAWIIIGLVAAYLVGQLMMVWRTRNQVPPPPPGGWRSGRFEDEVEGEDGDDAPRKPPT